MDIWVTCSGFTASLPTNTSTRFSLDDAPDPSNCWATYIEAPSVAVGGTVTTQTSGC